MQLKTAQLRNHLKQNIQPIYFVYGDEPLQIRENTDMLRKAAKYYGYEERQVYNADISFKWSSLQLAASEISLFSSKKLIEIYLPTGKPGDKGTKAIVEYCKNIPEETVLLIYTGSLDSNSKKNKWFKQLLASAVVIAVYPLKDQLLKQWLVNRLHTNKLQCEGESIDFLAEYVQGNLLAADQEIIKLALLYREGETELEQLTQISLQQVMLAVNNNAKYNGFDLFDTVIKGDVKQTKSMLDSFEQEGVAIVWLTVLLAKELRTLSKISVWKQQMSLTEAINKAWVFPQRKPLLQRVLNRNPNILWEEWLLQLSQVDKQTKGVEHGNAWLSLQVLLINLSSQIS